MNVSEKTKARENLYTVLDLTPSATHNEILHAYSRAKMTYSGSALASYSLLEEEDKAIMLEKIERAFDVLGNPSRRKEYDLKMGFEGPALHSGDDLEAAPMFQTIQSSLRATAAVEESRRATPVAPIAEIPVAKVTPIRKVEIVKPDYEPNPEFEEKIKSCEALDGAFLKAVRIYRRMTIDQMAQLCKLSPANIVALEEEDGATFRQPVYLRGHVLLVCRTLELPDPERLARSYLERMKTAGKMPKSVF